MAVTLLLSQQLAPGTGSPSRWPCRQQQPQVDARLRPVAGNMALPHAGQSHSVLEAAEVTFLTAGHRPPPTPELLAPGTPMPSC